MSCLCLCVEIMRAGGCLRSGCEASDHLALSLGPGQENTVRLCGWLSPPPSFISYTNTLTITTFSRAGWARGETYRLHYSMETRYLLSNTSTLYLADNSSGRVRSLNYPLWAPANTVYTTELR